MKRTIAVITCGIVALFGTAIGAHAAVVSGTPSSYGVIQGDFESGATDTWQAGNSNADRVGAGGAGGNQRINEPVWGFTLPSIGAGSQIDAVDFGFTMASAAITSGASFTAVISLMNYNSIDDFSPADYTASVGSLGSGTLVATFNDTDIANDSVESFSLTGAALTLFQSLYDASGNPTQSDVWFRLSHDNGAWDYGTMGQDRYNFLDDGTGYCWGLNDDAEWPDNHSLKIHGLLLRDQLEELVKLVPDLLNQNAFVGAYLNGAGRSYSLGMRAYYMLLPLVFWLFGPIFMVSAIRSA